MYTQCPECDVAFRVTTEVLKQAAGKVRCGGCGVAFNALLHLSDEMPGTAADIGAVESDAPKLPPEDPAELEAGTPPKSISAEQSAALLKTLDQLAGEDIRIEDTGIEWRVLDPAEDNDVEPFEYDATPTVAHEEMRFDDNTPLPDDFDLDSLSSPAVEPVVEIAEPTISIEDSQVDLAFGEPDEWEDLLDDLEAAAAAQDKTEEPAEAIEVVEKTDISAEIGALADIEVIDAEVAADQPLDMDTQFAIQAEAMGIDLSGIHARAEKAEAEEAEAEEQIELELVQDPAEEEPVEEEIAVEEMRPENLSRAGILDEDDTLEVITEDVPEDITEEAELEVEEEPEAEADPAPTEEEIEAELEIAFEEFVAEEDNFDDAFENFSEPDVIKVPEPTEEERTINMMIDQDLLAIAIEDDDGFTSTIVQKQISSNEDIPKDKNSSDADDSDVSSFADTVEALETPVTKRAAKSNQLMETIIMEGDSAHSEEDLQRREEARLAASASLKKSGFDQEKNTGRNWEPPRFGMIAAAVLLFIVLTIQVIHHSRDAFATSSTFQSTIGPIYRMVGSPVTPAWDIKGWRFEATKGSMTEEDQVLTIYSRIGNTSEQPLPYPLVHISLTDRFEEIIGSRVLEPAEYLVGNSDPRRPVNKGRTFDAVFTINTPSVDVTGFKLNVCYRLTSGQLRCAIEDFK